MLNIDISEIIGLLPSAIPNGLCASIRPVSIKTLQEQHGEGPNKFLNDVSELIQVWCFSVLIEICEERFTAATIHMNFINWQFPINHLVFSNTVNTRSCL